MSKIFQNRTGAGFVSSYLIVLLIVIGIGILAAVRLDQISVSVDDLTNNLAADMALSKEIVSQALLARFYANKYISTQSQADLDHFNAEFIQLEALLVQADRQIANSAGRDAQSHQAGGQRVWRYIQQSRRACQESPADSIPSA